MQIVMFWSTRSPLEAEQEVGDIRLSPLPPTFCEPGGDEMPIENITTRQEDFPSAVIPSPRKRQTLLNTLLLACLVMVPRVEAQDAPAAGPWFLLPLDGVSTPMACALPISDLSSNSYFFAAARFAAHIFLVAAMIAGMPAALLHEVFNVSPNLVAESLTITRTAIDYLNTAGIIIRSIGFTRSEQLACKVRAPTFGPLERSARCQNYCGQRSSYFGGVSQTA
jgi:hypothetical protein